jgi:hypothetical protein
MILDTHVGDNSVHNVTFIVASLCQERKIPYICPALGFSHPHRLSQKIYAVLQSFSNRIKARTGISRKAIPTFAIVPSSFTFRPADS